MTNLQSGVLRGFTFIKIVQNIKTKKCRCDEFLLFPRNQPICDNLCQRKVTYIMTRKWMYVGFHIITTSKLII